MYKLLKFIIKLGIKIFYSEVKIRNRENLQHDGPTIYIANHPNTLIDAWLVAIVADKPVYFMTKATYFNSKWKMKLLRSLGMIPVNRASESKTKGVNNSQTFEECYQLLSKGKSLVIFPEGTSLMEFFLRELKSGTARIALESELRNNGKLNLKVIPIGLNYMQGEKFRSNILVNCGEGIGVTEYLEEYEVNHSAAAKKLTEKFRSMLEEVLVAPQTKEQEKLVVDLASALHSRYLKKINNVESEFELMKKIRDRIVVLSIEDPKRIELIQWNNNYLNWKTGLLKIKNDFLDRGLRSVMFIRQIVFSLVGLLIGFPLFVFGVIHNVIPYLIIDFITPRLTASKEFFAPLIIILGLFLYPLTYLLFTLIVCHYFHLDTFWIICYILSMPILGMFAFGFARYMQHVSYKLNYIFLIINNKKMLLEMKEQRKLLFQLLFED